MGKIVKARRSRAFQPKPKFPAVVQMRKTEEFLHEVERQAGKMRRLLWLAVQKAGGRISFTSEEFTQVTKRPANETIIGIEQVGGDEYAIVFQDADGKRLPESEPKGSIILTDK